ncbi:class I tRNA ligase family protein [Lentzea tibetensis]|uniref:valine--tRNA ligase n=1 Tax=Lentzea tibetensis TaxID=2591470 RepID=A0A563F1D1_9PSEU|nr:class I tRNA ligase family protein [Lentzea tibetensis]TWP53796.1 class I tRNA ligase family protein [Lentzea tibetensis]
MAVITVGAPSDDAHRSRMSALADAHRRREALFRASGPKEPPRAPADVTPGWRAIERAMAGPSWGERVDAKHRKAIRRIPGAIIHFPLVGGGAVDTFITDWSPLPGACAIAVHPGHELAGDGFTGRFARHPLTGDLLPVWTTDWVKPDFGTGAVVVNPAHSEVDLEFAREVGLPVRFALADQPPTADPATWPAPPVIKQGVSLRTGQPHDEAAQRYLDELCAAGHAEPISLPGIGRHHPNEDLLNTLLADPDATVIATADAVAKDLLWARAALAELGTSATPGVVTDIPVHNPQQVESITRNLAAREPGDADRKLLRELADGDFAAAFKTLRTTRDRASAQIGAHVLFGTQLPAEVVVP